ncbi:MAG: SET domain-containing protein-lysine N-methyltransferase [Pyrinomonadaceae bacterium]
MKSRFADGLAVGPSPINGLGCFATRFFPKRGKIVEYSGERISRGEVARRKSRRKLRICAINQYWSLDGSRGGNGSHYINHCCEPNSYIKILYGHILFIALRDIHPGDEITCDYISTYHSDGKRCSCKAPSCRGTINKQEK